MYVPKGGVAVFDSGIGGLTVLAVCKKNCPETIFYYYGDNARAPYGNLSDERIYSMVQEVLDSLMNLAPRAVILACNTVTAVCIERLRARYACPIIGTEPALGAAMRVGGETLVLATHATCQSARFSALCQTARLTYPNAKLRITPCQELAGVIEKHIGEKGFDFTPYLPKSTPVSVVLGCTHYAYIKEEIEGFYGCKAYDGSEGIARRLFCVLSEKNDDKSGAKSADQSREGGVETAGDFSQDSTPIFFLGPSSKRNYSIYEQMFAILEK